MPQAMHCVHGSDTSRMHNCMDFWVEWSCDAVARSNNSCGSIRRKDGVSSEGYRAFGLPVLAVNNLPFHSLV